MSTYTSILARSLQFFFILVPIMPVLWWQMIKAREHQLTESSGLLCVVPLPQ